MLTLPACRRIFVATSPVHAATGIDRLAQIVRDGFGEDPFTGDLFCFFNRRRNRVKILVWDRNGFWILSKRLERGCFEKVDLHVPRVELDRAQLAMLLEGIDTRSATFRKHYVRKVCIQERTDGHGSAQPAGQRRSLEGGGRPAG